jgi:uncharacterized protein (TIGR03067 family)
MRKLLTVVLLGFAGALVAADTPKEELAKKELEKFGGTWKAVTVVRDGKEAPPDEVAKTTLTVKGEKYTFRVGDETIEGTHKLDPTKSPREIDAVRTEGPDKGKPILGVYELTDDTFKVCFAPAGKERPAEFASKAGSGNRLMTFKRDKK